MNIFQKCFDNLKTNKDEAQAIKKAAKIAQEKLDALVREEKTRILGIFNAPGAERNPETATHLAFETSTPLEEARAILSLTDEVADRIKQSYEARVKSQGRAPRC
jgi:S-methylmethionine-dependent homocysteine/selenocysteine methylase